MEDKEFLERCGFTFVPKKEDVRFGGHQEYWSVYNHWIYPDNSKRRKPPIIDLDFLFEYALPKFIKGDSPTEVIEAYQKLFNLWLEEIKNTADIYSICINTYPRLAPRSAIEKVLFQGK